MTLPLAQTMVDTKLLIRRLFQFRRLLFLLCAHATLISSSTIARRSATKLYLPRDVVYDSPFRHAVQAARSYYPHNASLYQDMMQSVGACYEKEDNPLVFTITMAGDKDNRARIEERFVNQDRSFVLTWENDENNDQSKHNHQLFMGVLDGHGGLGHDVAEHIRFELVRQLQEAVANGVLEQQPKDALIDCQTTTDASSALTETTIDTNTACPANAATPPPTTTTTIVTDFFKQLLVSIDANLPPEKATMGGATASLVYFHDNTLYFVNTGDSQSFLLAAICNAPTDCTARILYQTRLDKPDHPDEYNRLRAAGLDVITESGDDTRVWYKTVYGNEYGLAMSRSIGDWPSSALGVIPDPTVQVVSINETITEIAKQLERDRRQQQQQQQQQRQEQQQQQPQQQQQCDVSIDGTIDQSSLDSHTTSDESNTTVVKDNIQLFVICATDGLIDFVEPAEMARHLSRALGTRTIHPVTAAADLMRESATRWHRAFHGEYRDDQAIAVAKIQFELNQ